VEEIKTYIESGVLELYVMGDLNQDERTEVEFMAASYPGVKQEIIQIQNALEGYAEAYAVAPPEQLRERVINKLFNVVNTEELVTKNETVVVDEPKVIQMAPQGASFYKYAFAASVALLIVSLSALLVLYNRLEDSNEQLAVMQASNQTITSRANYINKQLSESQEALSIFYNPEVKLVKLAGQKIAPEASAIVAFNPTKQEVMLDMNAVKMPVNDQNHQYQLWALVDGKPVDLGVFDASQDANGMKRMKTIANAQAFAITLEPRGGSINPTMEQMMVMGAI
jgi:anti-sigma-K factor RskA